ncbi:MAG: hypothetical protein HN979_01975 [Actinobacteria bacterium]|jgi:hypothetical protein|nr:hypothetical protein [Actinomycetota bacterium]MBT3688425.1 hypothetical protein [Actinomycetota bacterium]MBT4037323.1 hypothetical protein [Actinomycetota bacterium]MBT4278678.1 hypothetical protein [Actinomycetota bacterium]MBT4343436.1 hypothetical protein [Actinomycetota bacterium]
MKKIDLSGGTTAGLVIGSVVIAAASMVVSLVTVAGAQTEVDTEVPAAHDQHDAAVATGAAGHGGAGHDERLAATAEFQGLDSEGLRSQLQDGATIAELAGDDLDGLIAQQLGFAGEHIGEAVVDGRIDQARADEMLSGLSERITARMNGEMPEGMSGMGGMCGMSPGGMDHGSEGHGA